MNNFLTITISKDVGVHKDIELKIPSIEIDRHADGYFLFLDEDINTDADGYEKVVEVLKCILRGWISRINSIKLGGINFLPFDFSDQYIGCLRVEMISRDNLFVSYGYTTKITGVDVNASSLEDFVLENNDFKQRSPLIEISKEQLLRDIQSSLEGLDNGLQEM